MRFVSQHRPRGFRLPQQLINGFLAFHQVAQAELNGTAGDDAIAVTSGTSGTEFSDTAGGQVVARVVADNMTNAVVRGLAGDDSIIVSSNCCFFSYFSYAVGLRPMWSSISSIMRNEPRTFGSSSTRSMRFPRMMFCFMGIVDD
jgi:hypothetical protein